MGVKSLAVGLIAGYVLGSKAGRERYEQISKVSSKVWNSAPVQAVADKASDAAGHAFDAAKDKASEAVDAAKAKAGKAVPFFRKDEDPWAVEADIVEF